MKIIVHWRKMTQPAERPMRDHIYLSRQSWAGHLAIYQYRWVMTTDSFDTTYPLGGMTILGLQVPLHVN
jgi:hypothetical protein